MLKFKFVKYYTCPSPPASHRLTAIGECCGPWPKVATDNYARRRFGAIYFMSFHVSLVSRHKIIEVCIQRAGKNPLAATRCMRLKKIHFWREIYEITVDIEAEYKKCYAMLPYSIVPRSPGRMWEYVLDIPKHAKHKPSVKR